MKHMTEQMQLRKLFDDEMIVSSIRTSSRARLWMQYTVITFLTRMFRQNLNTSMDRSEIIESNVCNRDFLIIVNVHIDEINLCTVYCLLLNLCVLA